MDPIINKGQRLIGYMKQYTGHYILGVLAVILVDVVQLNIPVITGDITNDLQYGVLTMPLLMRELVKLLIIGIIITLGRFAWRYYIFGTSRHIEKNMRRDYFIKLESLSTDFFNEHKTGDLMAYATNDLNAIRMMVGPGVLMALDAVILTVLVLYKMIGTISLKLTLISILPLPVIAIGSLILGKFIRKRFKDKQEAFAHLSDLVQENISGMRVIKAFVKETYEIAKFNVANQHNYDKNMHVVKLFAIMMPLVTLISGLSIAIALGLGGRMTIRGEITLGDFVAFVQYILILVWPMMAFGWCINIVSQGMASLSRYEKIMATKSTVVDKEALVEVAHIKGSIQMQDLTFAYKADTEPVLKNISLSIEAGQSVGILGRTGSGKTTLANLLLRLFDPPENTVFLDGVDVLDLPLEKLRKSFGYVPQDNFLFSDTIINNIGFAKEVIQKEAAMNVAKEACVHDNIEEFKEGYDTIVGERGVTLSGGQKQRISIARALLCEAPVLILDDAVSAVDTKTEEAILDMLKHQRGHQTQILIAHRISTIQHADLIIVLDDGHIVEQGNHETLINNKSLYYEMVKQQQLEKEIIEEG
ncbi:ABC transporter ATP-binding protein [Petrocella sp. FN5]|uniref:ABC transporter ATP-binding protein n=1 Tax=Petrocella sp. FN5 TaxID=3032002 RepID=UPI0023DBCAB3|nr:ABC transporter ATP-binding protein [Petrocella sp. FN5]MDF1617714.1 ABC transporter ATP-binding protein [Petrocella sp. FN5]